MKHKAVNDQGDIAGNVHTSGKEGQVSARDQVTLKKKCYLRNTKNCSNKVGMLIIMMFLTFARLSMNKLFAYFAS